MSDPNGSSGNASNDQASVPPDTLLKDLDPGALARAGDTNKQEASRHAARNANLVDAKFQAAVEIVRRAGKASTTLIMRELGLDYNQAARIIEQMEGDGLISRPDHTGKREVHDNNL